MKSVVERLRYARKWKRFRSAVHSVIDGAFYAILDGYELPHNSRWSLFVDMFWIECPVCLFYRGATVGFALGLVPFFIMLFV